MGAGLFKLKPGGGQKWYELNPEWDKVPESTVTISENDANRLLAASSVKFDVDATNFLRKNIQRRWPMREGEKTVDELIPLIRHECTASSFRATKKRYDNLTRQLGDPTKEHIPIEIWGLMQGIVFFFIEGFTVPLKPNILFDQDGFPKGVSVSDKTRMISCDKALQSAYISDEDVGRLMGAVGLTFDADTTTSIRKQIKHQWPTRKGKKTVEQLIPLIQHLCTKQTIKESVEQMKNTLNSIQKDADLPSSDKRWLIDNIYSAVAILYIEPFTVALKDNIVFNFFGYPSMIRPDQQSRMPICDAAIKVDRGTLEKDVLDKLIQQGKGRKRTRKHRRRRS
jgi:hypothetical protein